MPQFIRPKMLTLRSAFTVVLWPSEILPLFTTSERRALRLSTAEAFFFAGILAASRQAGGRAVSPKPGRWADREEKKFY